MKVILQNKGATLDEIEVPSIGSAREAHEQAILFKGRYYVPNGTARGGKALLYRQVTLRRLNLGYSIRD